MNSDEFEKRLDAIISARDKIAEIDSVVRYVIPANRRHEIVEILRIFRVELLNAIKKALRDE